MNLTPSAAALNCDSMTFDCDRALGRFSQPVAALRFVKDQSRYWPDRPKRSRAVLEISHSPGRLAR